MILTLFLINIFLAIGISYFSDRYPRFVQLSWIEQSFDIVRNYRPSLRIKAPIKTNRKFKRHFFTPSIRKRIYLNFALLELYMLMVAIYYPSGFKLTLLMIFAVYTLSIAWIDLDHQYIFDSMSISLMWIGLAINLHHTFTPITTAVTGAISGYLLIYAINALYRLFTKKEGLGLGDAKLIAAFGAWFGWQVIGPILLIAGILLLLTYIYYFLHPAKKTHSAIGFAPFLVVGAWVSLQPALFYSF